MSSFERETSSYLDIVKKLKILCQALHGSIYSQIQQFWIINYFNYICDFHYIYMKIF